MDKMGHSEELLHVNPTFAAPFAGQRAQVFPGFNTQTLALANALPDRRDLPVVLVEPLLCRHSLILPRRRDVVAPVPRRHVADRRARDDDLHAPVLLAPLTCRVGRNRTRTAETARYHRALRYALAHQQILN